MSNDNGIIRGNALQAGLFVLGAVAFIAIMSWAAIERWAS